MDQQNSIRPAELSDIPAIQKFLSNHAIVHRHLDWREPWDWVNSEPFLLLLNPKKEIKSILCCTPEVKDYYWIRLFAYRKSLSHFQIWNSLFHKALNMIKTQSEDPTIIALAYHAWMTDLLEIEGWTEVERVVQLEWNYAFCDNIAFSSHTGIRKMQKADIQDVYAIDSASFQPLWRQSAEAIEAAFNQSSYSTVFEENNHTVGFQMSATRNKKGHLARIAVHPDHRRRHIGEHLIRDLLKHCVDNKVFFVSVNTQVSNIHSISLYKKMSFQDKGNAYPIFSY